MKLLSDCRLYTFVDASYLRGRQPEEIVRQLCDGGSDLIQFRAKGLSLNKIRQMTKAILPITARAGVWFVINDHPRVASETGAPVCHLGQEDFFGSGHTHASQLLPRHSTTCPELKLGLSTHSPAQAGLAIDAGADYLAIGPVYATRTKPEARPVTLDYVRWAATNVKIPWFAIGGINLRNLDEVLAAGARRVCIVSAILNASDIAGACQKFKNHLASTRL